MGYPDFLCIGVQKSGTTWLDSNLRPHPELWLPPAKELHYFDRPPTRVIAALWSNDPLARRRTRGRLRWVARDILLSWRNPAQCLFTIRWYRRFLLLQRSDRWYASLFAPGPQQKAGEVCPGYSLIDADRLRHVQRLMPDGRFILLLRDPIDRVWSQLKMKFGRDAKDERDGTISNTIHRTAFSKRVLAHSTYSESITRWQRYFAPEQFFIGFFEQLSEAPEQLILDIFRFLGVRADPLYITRSVRQKRFSSSNRRPIPAQLRAELSQTLYPELFWLHERFDNRYTANWLKSASQPQRPYR